MPILGLKQLHAEPLGDFRRRQASHFFKLAAVLLPANAVWLWWLIEAWSRVSGFWVSASLVAITLGLLVLLVVFLVGAPFSYLESIFHPRSAVNPKLDFITLIVGIVGSYAFALLPAMIGINGLISGTVRLSKPSRIVARSANPDEYWGGVFLWFGIALFLLVIISLSWRLAIPRFRRFSNPPANPTPESGATLKQQGSRGRRLPTR